MKISRFNLKILESELDSLERDFEPLRKAIKSWANPIYKDQEWIATQRNRLENELTAFRDRMAVIYDFMGDRGLANFEPTSLRNARELEREPFPEDPGDDEEFIPEQREYKDMVIMYGDEE